MEALSASHERNALLVLGMHRSGTSATTRVLNLLGAELGENLMGPGYSNDLGFWEHMDAYQINDRLLHEMGMSWNDPRRMPDGWESTPQFARALREIVQVLGRDFLQAPLWAVKDPRICRLVPLWRKALEQQKVVGRAVLVVRHPDEIAGSLAVRDGLSRGQVHLLWARHMCEAERATRGMPRCVIRYDRLLNAWRAELTRASEGLGLDWPVGFDAAAGQIDAFLDRDSRHHVVEHKASGAQASWVDAAYEIFGAVSDSRDWTHASALVDEFDRATRVCDAYLDQTISELDALIAQRSRFEDRTALLDAARQDVSTSLQEAEARSQAGLAALLAESERRNQLGVEAMVGASEDRLLSTIAALLTESEARTTSNLLAASDSSNSAISERVHEVLACVQGDARLRDEWGLQLVARMAEEAATAIERGEVLAGQLAELMRRVGDRSQELDESHAEATRLRSQLDASRLEAQRQQNAFSRTNAELHKRVEAVMSCAFVQAGVIWDKDQEIATLGGELEATKQSLEAAIRLADSLDARLKHATRPWYQRLVPDKNPNLRKDDR
jgi:hypothetical protein